MFALKDDADELFIRLHPQWREMVEKKDCTYIEELLSDMKQRAVDAPKDLFQQLSALSVGPLITSGTGLLETINPFLSSQCSKFIPLY